MTAVKNPDADEILQVLNTMKRLQREGYTLDEALDEVGIDELTYFRYRADYGALGADQLRRLRKLEIENLRLRRAVSDLMLDKLAMEEATWASRSHAHAS